MSWRTPLAVALALLCTAGTTRAWELRQEWTADGLDLVWSADEAPAWVKLNGREWLSFPWEGAGTLGRPGEPALPLVSRLLELPVGRGLTVTPLEMEWETLTGVVVPEQERIHEASDLPLAWIQDERAYAAEGPLPSEAVMLGDPALIRGARVRQFALAPVRCLPAQGRTQILRSARWHVAFTGDDPRATPAPALAAQRPDWLAGTVLSHPVLMQEADRARDASNPGAYLVIARNTTVSGNAALASWLDWKRQRGHAVTVALESTIGGWTASAIQSYIRAALSTWSDPPAYVVLVGDPSITSTDAYYLPTGTSGYDGSYDQMYALADNTDNLGDVAVGRLSVENAAQLATVANKLVYYETTPTQAGTAWLGRAALCTGWDAISMIQQSRTIARDMIQQGITAIDTSWHPNTSSAWVNARFNAGISLYNYRGWIGMNGVGTSFISDAGNFLNYGMPPVTAIFTCSTGDFESTYEASETEAFLRKGDSVTPQGASAALGFATSNTHTAYNNAIAGGFWSAFLDRGTTQVGNCLLAGELTLAQTLPPGDAAAVHFANWANLMGDPGMEMWCGVPTQLTVAPVAGGTSFPVGAGEIQFQVTAGGSPVADVLVCLQQGSLQSRGRTDAAGRVWLSASGAAAGTVYLTASKHDHLPHRATLTATSAQFPRLVGWNIPGDGKLQPGETAICLPIVQNTGTSALTNLALTVTSLDAGLVLGDATANWGTIAAGAQGTATGGISVTAGSTLVDAARLQASLAWTSSQGSWTDGADFVASAPLLQPSTQLWTPGGAVLQPGSSCALTLTLTNSGGLAASNLALTLSAPGDPFVTVTSGNANLASLAIGASTTVNFTVTAAADAVRGHRATFTLTWSGGGLSGQQTFTTALGTATTGSPTGPDAYGYRAIESTDANSLAPAYNWVEIAPQAGGTGVSLGLTDTGDELDDATLVTLPFTFYYYGKPYTQMAVCSNGFVAFEPGAVDQTDYRNHYLPSGLGPDAMIAACWDDHIIPAGAGVYGKNDAANHRYIVEWYQLDHNGTSGINTFQLILVDPAYSQSPTVDGDFIVQYQTWNNNQENSYDFPGCTVGIKDEASARGLTLTNHNINDATIAGLSAGRAVLFTTAEGVMADMTAPGIVLASLGSVQPVETPQVAAQITDASGVASATLSWRAGAGAWTNLPMTNSSGDEWVATLPAQPLGTTVEYYASATDLAVPANTATSQHLSYTVVDGTPATGPDSHGYRWYDRLDATEGPDFIWHDISTEGTQVVTGDDATAVVSLPFPVTYFGTTYNELSICTNGFTVLGSTSEDPYSNAALAAGSGLANMVCAYWDDLNPGNAGQVRAAASSDGDRFVVSWIGVPIYGTSNLQTFQLVFFNTANHPTLTGDTPILAQYLTLTGAAGCTVGHQDGNRTVGINYLHNGTYAANAAALANGQALLLTTGRLLAPQPVDDLSITAVGQTVALSWTGNGADQYVIYGGATPDQRDTVDASTTATSVTLPVSAAQRYFDVRAVRNPGMAARAAGWLPVQVVDVHVSPAK